MCEWCDRLVLRNYKWDRHTAEFGQKWHMFNTMKSKWHMDWFIRKDWRRAGEWVEEHTKTYSPYYGLGSRYWSSYD